MRCQELKVQTHGEGFYEITKDVLQALKDQLPAKTTEGIFHLFISHTSCALVVNEAFDPSAKEDMENFLKNLAPRDLPFIRHRAEGPDDSPSHMKSILLQQNIAFPVEAGEILMGTWQGIYLAEFRDAPQGRKLLAKFVPDPE